MRRFLLGIAFLALSGCTAVHSPYDLYTMCVTLGSTRLTSIGAKAHNDANCAEELKEDLQNTTPRILYVPKDIAMAPVIAARSLWVALGFTTPPF